MIDEGSPHLDEVTVALEELEERGVMVAGVVLTNVRKKSRVRSQRKPRISDIGTDPLP